jgi:hypothetical protein
VLWKKVCYTTQYGYILTCDPRYNFLHYFYLVVIPNVSLSAKLENWKLTWILDRMLHKENYIFKTWSNAKIFKNLIKCKTGSKGIFHNRVLWKGKIATENKGTGNSVFFEFWIMQLLVSGQRHLNGIFTLRTNQKSSSSLDLILLKKSFFSRS